MSTIGPNGYAFCEVCGKEMVVGGGCGQPDLFIGRKKYARVRNMRHDECHDCNAGLGHVHHWGCDMERCPQCGLQLIGCDCKNVSILTRKAVA